MSDLSFEGPDSPWPPQMRFRREVDVPWSLLAPLRLDVWGFPCCRRGFKHFRLKGKRTLKVRNEGNTCYLPGDYNRESNLMRAVFAIITIKITVAFLSFFAVVRNLNLRPAPTLPTPAVVEQHTEQDEHQQGQRAQDGEQEQGVVGGDVPQAWMRQTQSCRTNHGRKKSLLNFTSTTRCSTCCRRSDRTRRSKADFTQRFTYELYQICGLGVYFVIVNKQKIGRQVRIAHLTATTMLTTTVPLQHGKIDQ